MYTMRMLDHNSTSNNSSVLGATSSNSGSANALIGPVTNPMQSSLIGSLAASSGATGGATHTTGDRLDASSDSAVSSMGSERVPSLSDGEWGDGAGSDSAQEYHHTKYHGGPFDYSYNSRLAGDTRPIVAQKKHQMFGKRYFQDQNPPLPLALPPTQQQQGLANTVADQHLPQIKYEYDPYGMTGSPSMHHNLEGAVGPAHGKHGLAIGNGIDIKYPYSMDFPPRSMRHTPHDLISHNHTYTLPHGSGTTPRISTRDKRMKKAEEEHLTRDEKRARALQIPISVHDVINLPMDEFNERLSKYDLSETQLSLIRDIRRRGKNKVAAQNCRKRKLDQILSLADEVKLMKTRKEELLMERESVTTERRRIKEKFTALYRHVFQVSALFPSQPSLV
jgi:nuclear factor erythroid 2, invertebrate